MWTWRRLWFFLLRKRGNQLLGLSYIPPTIFLVVFRPSAFRRLYQWRTKWKRSTELYPFPLFVRNVEHKLAFMVYTHVWWNWYLFEFGLIAGKWDNSSLWSLISRHGVRVCVHVCLCVWVCVSLVPHQALINYMKWPLKRCWWVPVVWSQVSPWLLFHLLLIYLVSLYEICSSSHFKLSAPPHESWCCCFFFLDHSQRRFWSLQ